MTATATNLPDVIISGWPEKEYRFSGEWIDMPGPRAATRNRRVKRGPLYRAADGDFFYAAQYEVLVNNNEKA